jgi:2-haloacid dehalogenase
MTALRRRHILASLSNANIGLMVRLSRHGGLTWDAILGAEVAGAYKPDPAVYVRAAALLQLPAAQCLMVAAHASDLLAAKACGLRTAYVHRPTEFGDPQPMPSGTDVFDLTATSFPDLAQQLRR